MYQYRSADMYPDWTHLVFGLQLLVTTLESLNVVHGRRSGRRRGLAVREGFFPSKALLNVFLKNLEVLQKEGG